MKKIKAIILVFMFVCFAGLFSACGNGDEYNINFYVDGEIFETITTSGNRSLTLENEPSKDGYEFGGWYFDEDYTDQFSLDHYKETSLTSDVNVYAKWNVVGYKITYHSNNGEGQTVEQSFTVNDSVKAIENTSFEKEGFAFAGWCTKSNGVGIVYKEGSTISTSTSSFSLYAVWVPNENVNISFVGDDVHSFGYQMFKVKLNEEKQLTLNITPNNVSSRNVVFSIAEYSSVADLTRFTLSNGKITITSADFEGVLIQADFCGKRAQCMVVLEKD